MPEFSAAEGIKFYKDDACPGCSHLTTCNVFTDFRLEGEKAKYHQVHIVPNGQAADREGYFGCLSYHEYVEMKDRPDPDPGFGLRMSQQEYNRYEGAPDDTPRRLLD